MRPTTAPNSRRRPTGTPLVVELQSSILACRERRYGRRGKEWVEAGLFVSRQLMRVRYGADGTIVVDCPSTPDMSTTAIAGVTPGGLSIRSLSWRGRDPHLVMPDPTLPSPFTNLLGNHPCVAIATERSRGQVRPARFAADRLWAAADLMDERRCSWVRAEVHRDGKVWIGVPGRGPGLKGTLDQKGLDLAVDNPLTTS
jgi:hypothetical protein